MPGYVVREARRSDARDMLDFARRLFEEPGLDLPASPGEFQLTVEDEEAVIADHAERPNAVFLLALDARGQIVGLLNCHGSSLRALRHSCEMGVSVAKGQRGQGVGSALLTAMTQWARLSGVRRIELKVYARNEGAIRLYRRFGFEVEGRRRRAVYQDGEFVDDLLMALLV